MPKEVRADYQSKMRKPTDFEAFWQDVLHQVEAIPLAPAMVQEPLRTSDDIEVFQVFYHSLDQVRIAAWYCRPSHRAWHRFSALTPGGRSNPHWGDWYQPGWRPDHLHRRHAARNPCRGSRRPLPLWLPGC